jgi:hypothetical protein
MPGMGRVEPLADATAVLSAADSSRPTPARRERQLSRNRNTSRHGRLCESIIQPLFNLDPNLQTHSEPTIYCHSHGDMEC